MNQSNQIPPGGRERALRLLWCCGVFTAVLFVGLAWALAPLRPGVVELQLAFTPQAFGAIVHAWSPAQLALYRQHLLVDFALLVAYGSFGYLLATRTRLFAPLGRWPARAARWCLPLAAVCDALENLFHLWLTAVPRISSDPIYLASASLSSMKWLLLASFGSLVAYALIRAETDAAVPG